MYGFALGPLQFQPTGQSTFDLKNSNLGCAGFQEKFDTPPLKPTKTKPSFRKLSSPSTKLRMLFPTHLQARQLCPLSAKILQPLRCPSPASGICRRQKKSEEKRECLDQGLGNGRAPWTEHHPIAPPTHIYYCYPFSFPHCTPSKNFYLSFSECTPLVSHLLCSSSRHFHMLYPLGLT